jgi:hypothetical protein
MRELALNLGMMVPTLFSVYCLAVAYFTASLFRIVYNALIGVRTGRALKRGDWRVRLSWISAVIMIACSILYLAAADVLLLGVIVSNIRFILTPGFCVMGVYFLFDKIYDRYNRYREVSGRAGPALIMLAVCVFILLFLQSAGVALLTVLGLYAALIENIKKFYAKTKKLVFGDDDNDDGE